jgi:hypothetical protein
MWSQRMFEQITRHGGYDANRFRFVLSGWMAQPDTKGFGLQAAANAPLADYVGMAGYLGGWDAGGEADLVAKNPVERSLLHERFYPTTFEVAARDAAALSKDRAKPVKPVMYEAGPGYSLPGPGIPINPKEQEIGKSLGAAMSYFEQVLRGSQLGYGPQVFFMFRTGNFWSSHADDGRPHATTLGVGLINEHFLDADMLDVQASGVPEVDLEAITFEKEVEQKGMAKPLVRRRSVPAVPDVPVIKAYASRDASGRLSVAILSRAPEGNTPVELRLPASAANVRWQMHVLTADSAQAHNTQRDEVTVKQVDDFKVEGAKLTVTLPPHALVVLSPVGTVK